MEANKIAYGAKSIVLDNGVELTYCEMGEQKMPLEVTMRESKIYGTLELMGKRQNITYGIATKAGFDFNVAVKIAFRKGTARIRGTRDGDSISGLITLPVGDVDFTGTRV